MEKAGFSLETPETKGLSILRIEKTSYDNNDFETYVKKILGDDPEKPDVVTLSRLMDSFIEEKILLYGARAENITISEEEKQFYISRFSSGLFQADENGTPIQEDKKILLDRLLLEKYTNTFVKDIVVTDEEIKEYYEQNKRQFLKPERILVSQILVSTKDKAISLFKSLQNASEEVFRQVALTQSIGAEASKGGKMGLFELGQLPYEMEKTIFSLKEGEMSQVYESPYGFHLFRVDKRYESALISIEDATPSIRTKIMNQKVQEVMNRLIADLKEKTDWEFYPQNLSFAYQRNDR
ncbi:MAG: peptidyl-prolyl cis-trans isomerase [Candidatus Aminicenantes bacterium]|nr:peptidyl-prolyl cis-trans isomerase [Candidatus Aminicenantes bacterium]